MALKLRRPAGMITKGILSHRASGRPPDVLRTGAGSFKRLLGSRSLDAVESTHPAPVGDKEHNSESQENEADRDRFARAITRRRDTVTHERIVSRSKGRLGERVRLRAFPSIEDRLLASVRRLVALKGRVGRAKRVVGLERIRPIEDGVQNRGEGDECNNETDQADGVAIEVSHAVWSIHIFPLVYDDRDSKPHSANEQ